LRRIGCDASGEETDGVLLLIEERDALANNVSKVFFSICRDSSLSTSAMVSIVWDGHTYNRDDIRQPAEREVTEAYT
jgi:hypothetical protein